MIGRWLAASVLLANQALAVIDPNAPVCHVELAPNQVQNGGWDNGLAGWQSSTGPYIKNDIQADGTTGPFL